LASPLKKASAATESTAHAEAINSATRSQGGPKAHRKANSSHVTT